MPPSDAIPELSVGDLEVRTAQTLITETEEQTSIADRLLKFSSWLSAVRAIACIQRRINNGKVNGHSTVQDRERAERFIIRSIHSHAYKDDLKLLSKGIEPQTHKQLYKLDAFIDKEGVLRVGGRLDYSSLPQSCKHPAIIPKDHHLTKLIIAHCHEKVMHQGKGLTINEIRSNGYWIPGMNRAVTSFIWQCIICRKLRRSVEKQKMADLPPEQTEPSPPFTVRILVWTALGHFSQIKEGRSTNDMVSSSPAFALEQYISRCWMTSLQTPS